MKTYLLNIIKSEQINRSAPGVINTKKNHTQKNHGYSFIRRFKITFNTLRNIYFILFNLYSIKPKKFILPYYGHKYKELEQELLKKGFDKSIFAKPSTKKVTLKNKASILIIIISNFLIKFKIYKSEHSKNYDFVLLSYFCVVDWLKKSITEKYSWFIIGDLNSNLSILSAALLSRKQDVLYWQYSFLDFKPMPVKATIGFFLNNKAFKLSRLSNQDDYYWRNIPRINKMKIEDIKRGPVGIVLNNHANKNIYKHILALQKKIDNDFIIRLHPNSKLKFEKCNKEISIAAKDETLKAFSHRVSLAVCGNTQTQIKLIMLGLPVLQMANLDTLDYDLHHYIKDGIVPGIRKPEDFNVEAIISFYKSGEYLTPLYNHIGPQGDRRKPDLYDFVKTIH